MHLRKGKHDDLEVATGSTTGLQWKCPACGDYNDDSEQVCSSCTAIRADAPAIPKPKDITGDWESASPKLAEHEDADEEKAEPAEPDTEVEADTSTDTEADTDETDEDSDLKEPEPPAEPLVVSGALSSLSSSTSPTPLAPSSSFNQSSFSTLPAPNTSGSHFYLIFVNSPAASIIKSKVSIDFDDFDVISIGRNPENVIVVPDPEVSRKHAQFTMQGSRLMLKDLGSKNGTYVYNGKLFEQVSDSVEVKPNSLIKFGTGTIVRLTSE
jgi:hypothetical protein